MVKKIGVEGWELCYLAICMVMFGFWLGYILGGSSSWVAKPSVRDEVIPNGAVILSSMVVLFVCVKEFLHYRRKSKLQKRK